jgi:serine/threonine protein kinase
MHDEEDVPGMDGATCCSSDEGSWSQNDGDTDEGLVSEAELWPPLDIDSEHEQRVHSAPLTERLSTRRNRCGHKLVNRYMFTDTLGEGSYGKVKLCVERYTGRRFAVKILHKELLRRKRTLGVGNALDDVLQEIDITRSLSHPNVVRIHEVLSDPAHEKIYLGT